MTEPIFYAAGTSEPDESGTTAPEYPGRKVSYLGLGAVAGVAVATVVGVYFLYGWRVQGQSNELKAMARRAKQDGKLSEAANYQVQYLAFNPKDTEELAEYAKLTEQLAVNANQKARAYYLLDQVLRRGTDEDNKLRRMAVRLAVDVGMKQAAHIHLKLLEDIPEENDNDLLYLRAKWLTLDKATLGDAANKYRAVLGENPNNMKAWRELFAVQAVANRESRVDTLGEVAKDLEAALQAGTLTAENAKEARLLLSQYYLVKGNTEALDKHLKTARESGPLDVETTLIAYDAALRAKKYPEAQDVLAKALTAFPKDPRVTLAAARLELQLGTKEKAAALLAPLLTALPETTEQLFHLGSALLDCDQADSLKKVLARLGSGGEAAWAKGLLEAQRHLKDKKWGEARVKLERVRGLVKDPALAGQMELHLADCYQALGNPDQQAEAAQRAMGLVPTSPLPPLRYAQALANQGKVSEAVAVLGRIVEPPAEAQALEARLRLAVEAAKPQADQDWAAVEALVASLDKAKYDKATLDYFRADFLLVKGKPAEARKVLETLREADKKAVGPWLALIEMAGREQPRSDAKVLGLIEAAEQAAGAKVELLVARARLAVRVGGKEGLQQLQRLSEKRTSLPDKDRDALTGTLAMAFPQLGDGPTGQALLEELANRQPDNLDVRLLLAERAMRLKQAAEVGRLADDVERIEGKGGPVAEYARALACVAAAPEKDSGAYKEARRHLAEAGKLRKSWSRLLTLEAEIEEREIDRTTDPKVKQDKALALYLKALDGGESRAFVFQRAIFLLFQAGRNKDADDLMRRLPERMTESGDLGKVAIGLKLRKTVDPKETALTNLPAARALAEKDKTDARSWIFLGQVAYAAGAFQEAEAALRKACEVAPKEPGPRVSLIGLLARTDKARAQKELADAETTLPGDRREMALAACHELLGNKKEADQFYAAARKAAPNDARVLGVVATYYARSGQVTLAESLYRQILTLGARADGEDIKAARRALALLLAISRSYPKYNEALALIDANLKAGQAVEDLRVRVLVLATQPNQRAAAIQQFEGIRAETMPPDMRLLLVGLYESVGDPQSLGKARVELIALLNEAGKNPLYLIQAARFYLRQKDTPAARDVLDRLKTVDGERAEDIELQAWWLKEAKKPAEAVKLLEGYARAKPDRVLPAAAALEALELHEAAERLYRQLAAGGKPEGGLQLARYLGRQGKTDEALKLLDGLWGKGPANDVAGVSLVVLRAAAATPAQRARVGEHLARARLQNPASPQLLLCQAELEDMQEKYSECIQSYQGVLKVQETNVVALNNLAYYLSVREGKHDEALAKINQVIAQLGPIGELLDTRGLIHLNNSKPQEALQDFQAAIAQDPSAVKLFHQAQAQHALGQSAPAKASLQAALNKGLTPARLPALEREALATLQEALKR